MIPQVGKRYKITYRGWDGPGGYKFPDASHEVEVIAMDDNPENSMRKWKMKGPGETITEVEDQWWNEVLTGRIIEEIQ